MPTLTKKNSLLPRNFLLKQHSCLVFVKNTTFQHTCAKYVIIIFLDHPRPPWTLCDPTTPLPKIWGSRHPKTPGIDAYGAHLF